jgi:hypothetical protein
MGGQGTPRTLAGKGTRSPEAADAVTFRLKRPKQPRAKTTGRDETLASEEKSRAVNCHGAGQRSGQWSQQPPFWPFKGGRPHILFAYRLSVP